MVKHEANYVKTKLIGLSLICFSRQKQKEKLRDKKRKLREERERLGIDEDSIRGPKLIKMSDPEASQVSVAIDCGFDHLMNDLVSVLHEFLSVSVSVVMSVTVLLACLSQGFVY